MIELKPEIVKEVEDMVSSLESSKDYLHKKFTSIFEDFIEKAFYDFYYVIESDTKYNFESWIRRTCDEIVEGLIAGDMKYIKHARLVSDYDWEKLRKMRLAIWKEAGAEIANSTISILLKENEELKKRLENEIKRSRREY